MRPRVTMTVPSNAVERGDLVRLRDGLAAVIAVKPQNDGNVILTLRARRWQTPRQSVINSAATITVSRQAATKAKAS